MPRLKSSNFAVAELTAGITSSATSFAVTDATSFPDEGPFRILVHDNTPGFAGIREIMEVGSINKATNTFSSVLRGQEGTTAQAHSAGSRVEGVWTAGTHQELVGTEVINDTELALGYGASAIDYSTALSTNASAEGSSALAAGRNASASGDYSTALGGNASAGGIASVALGYGSSAPTDKDGVLGYALNNWKIPGTLNVTGTKNFEIPHPKPEKQATHVIRHGAVEAPSPGETLYRWKIEATEDDALVTINLPDYFVYLNKDVQIFVTPQGHFGNGYGVLNVSNEQLEIHCQYAGEYNVLVIGTRNDNQPSVQDWNIKGVEREIGESWTGETYVFEVQEILEAEEIKEVA